MRTDAKSGASFRASRSGRTKRVGPGLVVAALFVVLPSEATLARDWPAYRHDAARSGVTAGRLAPPLALRWTYRSPEPPRPAWPPPQPGWTELPKTQFDSALHVVADAKSVYVGSSVDDQVQALDLADGRPRWSAFAGGPVRLAPALADGRLYFGADDGVVRCVQAEDGASVWSFESAPQRRTVLGNGRVISLWPVRTGVLVADGRVYAGCGVFPYHGVSLFALEATDGRVAWRNDTLATGRGFSPQGHLLAAGDRLIVPSGRASPVVVDRRTGALAFDVPHSSIKGAATGTYGTVVDRTLFVGTQNVLSGTNLETGLPARSWPNAKELLATPDSWLVLKGPAPPAYGRTVVNGRKNDVTCYDRAAFEALPKRDAAGLATVVRWRAARPDAETMIVAGAHVVVGGKDEVVLLDAATGQVAWQAAVEGEAVELAVAHGNLLVSTTAGTIHCFAPASTGTRARSPARTTRADGAASVDTQAAKIASAILRESAVRRGFALLAGPDAVRVACKLASRTDLAITCVEEDAARLDESRRRVAALGLYGRRIRVETGSPESWPFPDLAANLIVDLSGGPQTEAAAKEVLRVLRPCGGVLLCGSIGREKAGGGDNNKNNNTDSNINDNSSNKNGSNNKNSSDDVGNGARRAAVPSDDVRAVLAGAGRIETLPAGRLRLTRGELDGSGWWTHQYADSGGTGSSHDRLVRGRLDVLWFGEPGADEFPDRHLRGPAPLVLDGKCFCQGWNFLARKRTLFCFDVYNGLRYWKRDVDGPPRLDLPAQPGNLACGREGLFVATGTQCVQLDAETGETRSVFETPADAAGTRPEWGWVAVHDGLLLGSTVRSDDPRMGDGLFAIDPRTGVVRWSAKLKEIRPTAIAAADGRVFCVENRNPAKKEAAPVRRPLEFLPPPPSAEPVPRTVVARDAKTGEIAWEKEVDLLDCGRWDRGTWGTLQMLAGDGTVVLAGAYTIYPSRNPAAERPHRALALSMRDGSVLWSQELGHKSRPVMMQGELLAEPVFFDLQTGAKILRERPGSTRSVPWSMGPRTGGCGSLSASECMVFGRGGHTIWRDVTGGGGSAFVGMRPGCLVNIVPAGGVVVQAEASSGCSCYQAVQSTVVFRPRVP